MLETEFSQWLHDHCDDTEIRFSTKSLDLADIAIPLDLAKRDGEAVKKALQLGVVRLLERVEGSELQL